MSNFFQYLLLLTALACSTGALGADDPYDLFDAHGEQIRAKVTSGAMTELDAAKDMSAYTDSVLPTDYKLRSVMNYRVLLASRLERGDIKRDEFDYLWKEKVLKFTEERTAEMQQANAPQQSAPTYAPNPAATALLLQGMGKVFRAGAPSTTRCVSTPVGASVSTTCN